MCPEESVRKWSKQGWCGVMRRKTYSSDLESVLPHSVDAPDADGERRVPGEQLQGEGNSSPPDDREAEGNPSVQLWTGWCLPLHCRTSFLSTLVAWRMSSVITGTEVSLTACLSW